MQATAAAAVWTAVEGQMRKGIEKKVKISILMVFACILCFFAVPLLMINIDGNSEAAFGMAEFFSLIFWPTAGTGISVWYAIFVKDRKYLAILPGLTTICLVAVNLTASEFPFFLSFLCLVFEAAGYGMIHFWSKIE